MRLGYSKSTPASEGMVPIDQELLDMLVCPLSRASLVLDGETLVSTDPETRRRYRIDDGIPVMLIEEAEELDEATWREIMDRRSDS